MLSLFGIQDDQERSKNPVNIEIKFEMDSRLEDNCTMGSKAKSKIEVLEQLKRLASKKGGACLSAKYLGVDAKLQWKCKNGHRWMATPYKVKGQGTWCPTCAKLPRLTIADAIKVAKRRRGMCVSKTMSLSEKLSWTCDQKHQWEALYDNVRDGSWCPRCARVQRLTIQDMHEAATRREGQCLSSNYVNGREKLSWRCQQGHEWLARGDDVRQGKWCPYCTGTAKLSIQDMYFAAEARGGKCLSHIYVNGRKKLSWECSAGHIWTASPDGVRQGKWCPKCAGTSRLSIEDMRALASERGGECLSIEYINSSTKLLWKCSAGHEWTANSDGIKQGKWCPKCAGTSRLSIEDMQILAEQRGGKCISTEYFNVGTKLTWQCRQGHIWNSIPEVIKRGGWCPECGGRLGERVLRAHFEQIFSELFPSSWPKWLSSPTSGQRLQLDGYCEKLNLAFEHQGKYHYDQKFSFKLGMTFEQRQLYDEEKRILCAKNDIKLIEIKELFSDVKLRNLKKVLKDALVEKRVELPRDYDDKEIDLRNAYAVDKLKEFIELALDRGGRCLSVV